MLVRILGSAAGGGFPQINCNCRNCSDVRGGKPGLAPRTQSSIAVSNDGHSWVLLNASPDLRQQVAATPPLSPRRQGASRDSPIEAVILTNGDVDHIAGLLSLREGFAFTLYASSRVLGALVANSVFNVLDHIGFFATLTGPDGRLVASTTAREFVMVGLCGGFTTFSAFSLQTLDLMQDGLWAQAGLNIGASVFICLLAVWLGHVAAAHL